MRSPEAFCFIQYQMYIISVFCVHSCLFWVNALEAVRMAQTNQVDVLSVRDTNIEHTHTQTQKRINNIRLFLSRFYRIYFQLSWNSCLTSTSPIIISKNGVCLC